VDPRLIYHYFGSKQQLFVAAIELPDHWREVLTDVLDGPDEEIGEHLVLRLLGYWEDPEIKPLVRGLIRSGMTSPMAAEMVRRMVAEGPFEMLAAKISVPDRELRAMCIASQMMGVAVLRDVLRVEPLASAAAGQLAAMIGPTVQHHLTV
jgi:AcrR family transcriptional regulator